MSFYDDSSLVFLPSGGAGKDTKAYSIKPTNGDGDFTFSRGSNLTATRVDSNGLIEKGRENLLLQSNQFDTTWGTSRTDVTPNQSGYDGSTDAWLLEADVAGSTSNMNQAVSISGVMTASIYAKEGTTNWFRFSVNDSGVNSRAWFDLSDSGDVGSTAGNIIDAKIESVDNGYFRCSITFNATAANLFLFIANADNSVSYSVGDNIYIQDAQLEEGLVATQYIESGASKGKAGLLENEPRFDYSGGASCASLLLEPSRTNLFEQSEYYEDTFWEKQGVGGGSAPIVTTNYATSPEGVQNATRIQFDASSSGSSSDRSRIKTTITIPTDNVDYTQSFYLKSTNGTEQKIAFLMDNSQVEIMTITSEWQRFDATIQHSGATGIYGLDLRSNFASTSDILVYAGQLEEGSYATSYIPTHSGGSVTRDADVTSVTSVSSLIGQTEGTIYCEFEYNGAANTGVFNRIIGLGTGVTQNRILLAKNNTTAELVAFAVSGGATQVFQAISGTSIIGHHKVAISYKANEYKVYLDGELEFTDSSALVPATTDVYVGTAEDSTTGNELGGVVKQSIIFKEVLSEDDCKALTTI